MTKLALTSKKPRKQHTPEFRSEALMLAEQAEELAIIQKAATYFAKRLK